MKNKKLIILIGASILVILCLIGVYIVLDKEIFVSTPVVEEKEELAEIVEKIDPQKVLFELSPGVNLAGAEFGKDTADYQHTYPTESIDYYASKGFKLFRLPFAWERIQPDLRGELNPVELNSIKQFVDVSYSKGAYVILDLHNYNRYNEQIVGQSSISDEDLTDVWVKLAQNFKDHPGVVAYGVMNEPYDSSPTWPITAQKSVDAIRSVDKEKIIMVAGDNWSQGWTWTGYNSDLDIEDPSDLIVYEAHVYFDPDRSGKYECSFDACNISLNVGQLGTQDFVRWLKINNKNGFIGEYGVPSDDPRWSRVLDKYLRYLEVESLGSTIWAGGPDWGDYNLSIEPIVDVQGDLIEKPQVNVLERYLD